MKKLTVKIRFSSIIHFPTVHTGEKRPLREDFRSKKTFLWYYIYRREQAE
jgi:hypothetical protein